MVKRSAGMTGAQLYRVMAEKAPPSNREFIRRGLASRAEARKTGEYFDSEDVLDELDAMLPRARAQAAK